MTTEENDIYDSGRALWKAELSDGSVFIEQIDGTWHMLIDKIKQERLCITNLRIQFRNEICAPLPANSKGYFLRYASLGILNMSSQMRFLIIGYLKEDDTIQCFKVKIPELMIIEEDIRTVEKAGLSLIKNNV